ncbi:translation initiation factor IF-2-like [Ictalurus punctatus]|uniref:Translation initiation factor IF-2-like n=1 Tax=Ictalurus punctatus TaxID=7998 RepID=A0A9F7RHN6_ICTPU|nr:translation initiation factor IF-2-like [Ictalurus punctatus]
MDAAGERRRRRTRKSTPTIPAMDSVHFPQWTIMELPDPFDGFFGAPEYFLVDCQFYFSSLSDPKPEEKHWLRFMWSRFFGPARQWVQLKLDKHCRNLDSVEQFVGEFMMRFGSPEAKEELEQLLRGGSLEGEPALPFTHYYRQLHAESNSENQVKSQVPEIHVKPPVSIVQAKPPGPEAQAKPPGPEAQAKPPGPEAQAKPPGSEAQAKPPGSEAQAKPPGSDAQAKPPGSDAQAKPPGSDAQAKPPGSEAQAKPPGSDAQAKPHVPELTFKPADPVSQALLISQPNDQMLLTPKSTDPVTQVQPTDTHSQVPLTPRSADRPSRAPLTPRSADRPSRAPLTPRSANTPSPEFTWVCIAPS